jgi:2'-5' RNA ligase
VAFIGIRIPDDVTNQFSSIEVNGTKEPPEKMHVTLAFLGEGVLIPSVLRALSVCLGVGAQYAPMDLTAALVMCFPPDPEGKTPVVARLVSPVIFTLRQALVKGLEKTKVEYSKRHPQYKPHVTLAYADGPKEPMIIPAIRWRAEYITIWGGDNGDSIFSSEIQLRGSR